jgi:hypothetical protein
VKRTTLFWIVAFFVTAASATYQRVTGPTYPLSGKAELAGTPVSYRLLRTQGGTEDAPVRVSVPDQKVAGIVEWKRFKTDDPWSALPMARDGAMLEARLPNQPPAGKLEYRVLLTKGEEQITLPVEGATVIRYKGDVPTAILIVHVIAMFGAMLLSTRTGLEYFNPEPRLRGTRSTPTGPGGLLVRT